MPYVPPSQRGKVAPKMEGSPSSDRFGLKVSPSKSTANSQTGESLPTPPTVLSSSSTFGETSERSYDGLLLHSKSDQEFSGGSYSGSSRGRRSENRTQAFDLLMAPPTVILFKDSVNRQTTIDYSDNATQPKIEVIVPPEHKELEGTLKAFERYDEETFKQHEVPDTVAQNIFRLKYQLPTPIQMHAIPFALAGCDLLATSQTGSGKTVSFLLPVITKILNGSMCDLPIPETSTRCSYPLAIVMAPVRELTQQITFVAYQLTYKTGLTVRLVYGGEGSREQEKLLRAGADIVVATPGRLQDFLERGALRLDRTRFLVLDEADRMLDMGFEPQIRKVIENHKMPPCGERQTLMFSATFARNVQNLASRYLKDAIHIHVGHVGSTTNTIEQRFEKFTGNIHEVFTARMQCLGDLIEAEETKPSAQFLTLIFVETKRDVSTVVDFLRGHDVPTTELHGDLDQRVRQENLKRFKAGTTHVLVATDVAQRGLDIGNVRHVINFEMPRDIDMYTHRIGRTGRAGATGLSTTFLIPTTPGHVIDSLKRLLIEAKQKVPDVIDKRGSSGYRPRPSISNYSKSPVIPRDFSGFSGKRGDTKRTYKPPATTYEDNPSPPYPEEEEEARPPPQAESRYDVEWD
ncbi:DEAD box RNA helicase Vasa [Giardia muris]|uniref:RNA helicase n=1 Tax=Giardia muris TaxID=5742 RepID=A0A4Z1SUB3_GIAMU|nr:DEAD box RNA helicase Vasa [Giardia muris]|eukprot:TNJ29492.1 DEAD box RNA helicase Vasa [Giardia muris]